MVVIALALLSVLTSAASADTRATGELDGSGTSYTLTVQNTGDQPIICMRFFAASGVRMTSVSSPAHLESPSAFAGEVNIPRGGSQVFSFTTEQQYPPGAGGTLNVSSTCSTGSDVSSKVTGPPQPGGGAPPPCQCFGMGAVLKAPFQFAAHGRHLGFEVHWRMACTPGQAAGCRGRIEIATSHRRDVKFLSPKSAKVRCRGKCGATTDGTKKVTLLLSKRLRPLSEAVHKLSPIQLRKRIRELKRAGRLPYRPLRVRLRFFCLDAAGRAKRLGQRTMTLKFTSIGQIDKKHSDLVGVAGP
jgi:hypothetical protein